MSVNFHVGQYAKIVEELKSEVSGLKRKNSALVEENAVLTQQVLNIFIYLIQPLLCKVFFEILTCQNEFLVFTNNAAARSCVGVACW